MKLLVTGGAGFIGSAVIRRIIGTTDWSVVNVDKLTYASSLASLEDAANSSRYKLEVVDICDASAVAALFDRYRPNAVLHLAAESHVDRSIDAPAAFIQTNIVGTYTLLQAATDYWTDLGAKERSNFRFVHVSSDEVFGSLGAVGRFTEDSNYRPNSPYSASKAASDHLARAWLHTFKLPVLTTNCSNNYGPYQFPEKLIPLTILNALEGKPLPIYGKGDNVRDWLFVDDHAEALLMVLQRGHIGRTYNVGGDSERTNLEVVGAICDVLDELSPSAAVGPRKKLMQFVSDRPGHDFRYAIDASRIALELGWKQRETFATGLRRTIEWYLSAGPAWLKTLHKDGVERPRFGILENSGRKS